MFFQNYRLKQWGFAKTDQDMRFLNEMKMPVFENGSSPFSGVSSLFTGVSDIFTSLFRRSSLFSGVSPKLLIILVSTRFFWSSSLFSGVLYSCHQIFLKLHQLSLKLPISFIAMLDASIVVLNFPCYDDWFATKNINLNEV